MKTSKAKRFTALLAVMLLLSGCTTIASEDVSSSGAGVSVQTTTTENNLAVESEVIEDLTSLPQLTVTHDPSVTLSSELEEPSYDVDDYQPSTDWNKLVGAFPNTDFDAEGVIEDIPFVDVNGGVPFFTLEQKNDTESFETYSELDELGRCGIAFANIGTDLFPTEERGEIGSVKPTGWQTAKYDKSIIKDMYLYNRCHLIAFMLAGENANKQNLITGTRYLNIEGMLPFENEVHDYLELNPDNHVLYRVTPMFRDNDLVAQGVLMESWSVEDNGEGVSYCVFCYNIQPNIHIDYKTGDNYSYDNIPEEELEETEIVDYPVLHTYILNTNTKKIHRTTCSAIADMKPQNREETSKPCVVLMDEGYELCGLCKPDPDEDENLIR